MSTPGHIFISYARSDGRDYAERLGHDLARAGFSTWRDTRHINEYQDFSAEIENAIRAARFVTAIVTPSIDGNPRSFVRRELIYAESKGKPIIPLVFPDATLPTLINHLTWIPFYDGDSNRLTYEDGFAELLSRLQQDAQPSVRITRPDAHHEYLSKLYDRIVYYLNQTVFSLIALQSDAAPDAVEEAVAQVMPMAFFNMAGIQQTPDMPDTFDNFYEAMDYYHGRVLLLGDPGAGKTTTLMAYARDAVWQRLEKPELPIPLLAPITTWEAHDRPDLAGWLSEVIPALSATDVQKILDEGRALLLLDGLDELSDFAEDPHTKEIYDPRQRFMDMLPANNQVVVSCRVRDYADIGKKIGLNGAITLRPLDDEQMQRYLRRMPDLWEALRADDELREMARTPLLLSLFTFAFAGLDEETRKLRDLRLGDLRDRIFQTYVQRRYERERHKLMERQPPQKLPFTLKQMFHVLGEVAMINAAGGQRPGWVNYIDNVLKVDDFTQVLPRGDGRAFIQQAVDLHVLVLGEGRTLRFIHLLLRDYFAFGFAMAHLKSDEPTERNIAAIALGNIGDTRAVPALIAALADERIAVRVSAAGALGMLGDERAVDPLIRTLRDERATVRGEAAAALGRLGDIRAIPSLIHLLRDEEADVLHRASGALGRLGSPAFDYLVNILADEDPNVRHSGATALGILGDGQAVPHLLGLLADTARTYSLGKVCDAAAFALWRIGTPEAREAFHAWRKGRR